MQQVFINIIIKRVILRMKMNEVSGKFFNFYVILGETKIVARLYIIQHSTKILIHSFIPMVYTNYVFSVIVK